MKEGARRYRRFGSSRFRTRARGGRTRIEKKNGEKGTEGSEERAVCRSRGTRRRGSGRKRETIVRVSWWTSARDENRASRLAPWKAKLGPNRVREVGRLVSVFLSPSPSVHLLLYFPPPLVPPTLAGRPSHFYFVCAAPRCAALSLPLCLFLALFFPLSLSLSFVGRKWFMAVPERRFRRGSCAEDRPLLPFILRLSSRSCHFIRHASSLRPPRSRAAVFLRGIPFFMHAIASFTFLTRRNGISVFYRLDYTTATVSRRFFASVEVSLLYNGRQNSVWPYNAGAVYHGSRKSIFEI